MGNDDTPAVSATMPHAAFLRHLCGQVSIRAPLLGRLPQLGGELDFAAAFAVRVKHRAHGMLTLNISSRHKAGQWHGSTRLFNSLCSAARPR